MDSDNHAEREDGDQDQSKRRKKDEEEEQNAEYKRKGDDEDADDANHDDEDDDNDDDDHHHCHYHDHDHDIDHDDGNDDDDVEHRHETHHTFSVVIVANTTALPGDRDTPRTSNLRDRVSARRKAVFCDEASPQPRSETPKGGSSRILLIATAVQKGFIGFLWRGS